MITIYSSDTCAPCSSLKKYLDRKKVEYRVFDADREPHTSQLWQLTGRKVVPTTIVNGRVIVGLNYSAIAEALRDDT